MSRSPADRLLVGSLWTAALAAAAIVFVVVAFLVWESFPALLNPGPGVFFSDPSWHPTEGEWGMAPMLWGSLYAALGAVLLATPLGVLSAVFCRFHAPVRVAGAYRRMIELLAGIPSVVYGFWGLVVLVPVIARMAPPGASLLAAILVLAVMILPTIALMADASLRQVPRSQVAAAYALGLSRSGVVWKVALPASRSGIFTGVMLGTARAIGETMAVLMVCGGVVNMPSSVFDPIRTLTANIALEMAYALDLHRSALFVSGLMLVGTVVVLVVAADLVERRRVRG